MKVKDKKPKPSKDGRVDGSLSRRDFLRVGAAVSGGILAAEKAGRAAPQGAAGVQGPGPVPVALKINGETHRLSLEPRVTLLDALRNHLDLTGAKRVCDRGTCGACTVILDGKPVYSCSVLAIEAEGHEITTVEGLVTKAARPAGARRSAHAAMPAEAEKLHPVMAAFIENDAQQCGFCTPGFVVACKAFLDAHPNPTPDDVKKGLGGNLCRCGTYHGVLNAVLEAAKAPHAAAKGGRAHGKV